MSQLYITICRKRSKEKKLNRISLALIEKGVIFIYQSTKLAECQKEFLFNSKYGYDEYHPSYKSLNYHCKKTDLREEIDIDNIAIEELPLLVKNVFDAISIYCNNCDYRM